MYTANHREYPNSIRSLVLFFGPILLPKAISYYRSIQANSRIASLPIQPVPTTVRIVLGLLGFLSTALLLKTLPIFVPENIFASTQSRLQIPVDVLFHRVAALRPGNVLTTWDLALKGKFVNLENRLLYLQFGPEVMAECPFCNVDEPRSFFYYALPALLWPHVANLIVVAFVTSSSWTGRYGSQWRFIGTIASITLAALDVYLVNSYNYQINARALRLPDIDLFYWSMRNYRFISLAALNASLGLVLYLSSTNRAFVQLPSPAERIELVNRALHTVKSKINALSIIKNTALRDEDLRSRSEAYWQREVRIMGEIMEERDVIDGVNDALSSRIDIQSISKDAETYAENVLRPLQQSMDE